MALINLFDIDKNYDVKQLLKGVNWTLQEGERVAVIGQNGCGKSTLMKIIQGEVEPDNGRVVINGKIVIEALEQNPNLRWGRV